MKLRTLRAWYISTQRLVELFQSSPMPAAIRLALGGPRSEHNNAVAASFFGPQLIDFIEQEGIGSLQALIAEDEVRVGARFTVQATFRSNGLAASNKGPIVTLKSDLDGALTDRVLQIEFGKDGLTSKTAWVRLAGRPNVFAFCSIVEITPDAVRAVPYVVADLVETTGSIFDLKFSDGLQLRPSDVDQFKNVDFSSRVSAAEFERLKEIPERDVKQILGELLGEVVVPKDWGGEENDLFSSNLLVDGVKRNAAFLLKGPAKFHEMTLADCGKNGDQIYRLFHAPADVFVLQHCHKVSPAVRRTMEAFALSTYGRDIRYLILDGYDTARILRQNGKL